MRTLYKYYSDLPSDYLKKPTLKLACPEHLNDPFENSISRYISEIPEHVDNDLSYLKKVVNHAGLSRSLSNTGVISMCETHRNMLLWAHYANEHFGLTIGYSEDILKNKFSENILNIHGISNTPLKVNYDTIRFDSESEKHVINTHKKVIRKILTTKGDDWIYEKEHRFLIPIYLADSIMANEKHNEIMKNYINKELIVKDDANGNLYFKERFTDEFYSIGLLESETDLLRRARFSFYINIDPEYINSVYFGCRCPNYIKRQWFEQIQSNSSRLSHIKLYEYDISKTDFFLTYNPYTGG